MKKYDESFDTPGDEIPRECPICKQEFDFSENISNDYYGNGIRTTLICYNCNFKKVLSFDTNEDIEAEMNEELNGNNDDSE
ncbi:MAG: hypothetical protein CVU95_01335 [Firmicutes bacterium HGW-Firmicutes-2]|jgi:C4-type Zn-finger protein|nr:MAG: hypothetical protein CVU95_01335 [Firmicutes bacterium HGW-Firmicutes-2]